jgi:hypothetical protein
MGHPTFVVGAGGRVIAPLTFATGKSAPRDDKPETGALSAAYPTQAQRQGLTPISCHAVLEGSACAPFIKERRMECLSATSLRRKSG